MPATASTTNLRDRLKAVESKIREARDERAGAQADLDRHREEFTRGGGQADNSNPAWRQAHAAAERLNAARGVVEALGDEQRNVLALFGEPGASAGASETSRDLSRPGEWLAAALHAETGGEPGRMYSAGTKATLGSRNDLGILFFDRLRNESSLASAIPNVLPIEESQVRIPRLTGRIPAAGPIAELAPLPEYDPPVETITVEPPKYGVLTSMSVEAYRDARPVVLAAVERELVSSISRGFDVAGLQGAAAPQVGLLNTPGAAAVAVGAGGLTNLDPFTRAIGALRRAGGRAGAIMVSPATWERIALLKDETGSARPLVPGQPISIADGPAERLAGVPVWVSEGMPDDRALVVDPTALLIVRRSGIELEVFEHFGFSTGEVGLRAIVRLSLVVSQPASVAVITGIPTT